MILTVTPNPSVDISYRMENFRLDEINRIDEVSKTAGGKGLNVARVLKILGAEVASSGFLGGVLGEWIEEELKRIGITPLFAKIGGETRNCISILHEGRQTEILERGPVLGEEDEKKLLRLLREVEKQISVVTFSGSLPKGLKNDFYAKLVKGFSDFGAKTVVDTSGDALREVLYGEKLPYAIKPNQDELQEILGKKYRLEEIPEALSVSRWKEIPLILISLGSEGALSRWDGIWYRITIPKISPVNPVGSGDSTVAGLAYGLERQLGRGQILKTAMACGVLNAMEKSTGYIELDQLEEIYRKIKIEEWR